MMTILFVIVIALGAFTGYFLFPQNLIEHIDLFITIALNLTLFSVGIGIGLNKRILTNLKKMGKKILLLPIGTIIGSLVGGIITGLLVNHTLSHSLGIAAGFGWYSLSAVLLNDLAGAEIGTIAFLSNVFRELLAFIFIPIVAKRITPYTAISIGGATTMDTTLPIVTRSTNEQYAVVSFIHGALLSFIVPVLVPFFANL